MNLTDIKQTGAGGRQARKRVGRGQGSGNGKTAGRGSKGQKSRSGGGVNRASEGGQMPLFRRLPKRGFTNKWAKSVATFNVSELSKRFDAGATVDVDALKQTGLLKRRVDLVKVLGDGEIDKALTVKVHAFSKGAREKIEAAGGTAETLA